MIDTRLRHGALALAALLLATPAAAQIPETFTNLQVMPQEVTRGQLVGAMREISGALDLRCNGCHVGEDPDSLEGYDFASDEKELKRVARAMMRMTAEINDRLLPAIGRDAAGLLRVECRTCHRGRRRPESLGEVLAARLEAEGVEAAIAEYRALREEYYGSGAFDFGENQLYNLAEQMVRSERVEDAHALIQLNLELYPEYAMNQVFLGRYHAKLGEADRAISHFMRAIEIDSRWAPVLQPSIDELKRPAEDPSQDPS